MVPAKYRADAEHIAVASVEGFGAGIKYMKLCIQDIRSIFDETNPSEQETS